ncbi:hypothetical protein THAOC_28719, partial [Thalassiosira oceanica]
APLPRQALFHRGRDDRRGRIRHALDVEVPYLSWMRLAAPCLFVHVVVVVVVVVVAGLAGVRRKGVGRVLSTALLALFHDQGSASTAKE